MPRDASDTYCEMLVDETAPPGRLRDASVPAAPVSWLERFPVLLRLFATTTVALVAITAVGAAGLVSITRERVAQSRIAQLNATYQRFRGAALECNAVRADVLALLSLDGSPQAARTALLASVEACRRDLLGSLAGSAVPDDFRAAITDFRPLLTDYLDRATAIAWLDPITGQSAVEHRAVFERAAEALAPARLRLDAVFEQRTRTADGIASGIGASGLRAVVLAWLLAVVAVATAGRMTAMSIARGLTRVRAAALAIADGDMSIRCATPVHDDVGELAGAVNRMADALQTMIARLQVEQEQDAFSRQLAEVLDMADTEAETYAVVSRGMQSVAPHMPMELLVADSSRAHLERATVHPDRGAPGCPVESPYGCMAVRRGNPVVFETSEALNACARLRERNGGPTSAVCVPLNFMGRALGVLHATGDPGQVPAARIVGQLTTLGMLAGSRIGTVRAFERTQLQASTDSLTGLLNRRSLEARVRRLVGAAPYAVAVADLDGFKRLNDTLGHDTGDRMLRVFADVLRQSLPAGHHVARWGGEEFVIVLEGHDARTAFAIAERVRVDLVTACQLTQAPAVTVSFGIADSTMGGAFEQLVRIADDALYQSKENGRDRTTIGDPRRVGAAVPRRDADRTASIEVADLTTMSS
jgi:diguanylate cyclase (GGDEF)-like protein